MLSQAQNRFFLEKISFFVNFFPFSTSFSFRRIRCKPLSINVQCGVCIQNAVDSGCREEFCMRKAFIILVSLGSVASADTFSYTGANGGLFSDKGNWTNEETGQLMGSSGTSFDVADASNTFRINGEVTVAVNSNAQKLEGAIVEIGNNSTLSIDGRTSLGAATITVKDGGSLTLGFDVKVKGAVINTNSAVTIGNTWFDASSECGDITFNLSDHGLVNYGTVTYRSAGNSAWSGSLTLSANCLEGALTGNGEVKLFERTLVAATGWTPKDGSTIEELLANHVEGGSITLNSTELTCASVAFDTNALTADNVGQYRFIFDDNKIKVQYVAYEVPEPATATLSLLALVGLAARRRRRMA
ncbi:MAG: PEP-CTERM sorting domain-containing protein [Akkermansia muciniphila]